uniref:hypothetical protein n=1 Tax=Ensifer adhaerens TaxID=106592 RepID=UPI003F496F1C
MEAKVASRTVATGSGSSRSSLKGALVSKPAKATKGAEQDNAGFTAGYGVRPKGLEPKPLRTAQDNNAGRKHERYGDFDQHGDAE